MRRSIPVSEIAKFSKCERLVVAEGRKPDPRSIHEGNSEHRRQSNKFSTGTERHRQKDHQSLAVKSIVVLTVLLLIIILMVF